MASGQDIDVGDMRISKDSLFLMKEMADPNKVDFGQKERTDIENAPSLIREQLKKSAREARHEQERKERKDRQRLKEERRAKEKETERRAKEEGRGDRPRSRREEEELRQRSSRREMFEKRERDDTRHDRRPPLVPPSSIRGPPSSSRQHAPSSSRQHAPSSSRNQEGRSHDVIRAKSKSGHEESMMAKAMEMARSRSRGVHGGSGDRGVHGGFGGADPLASSSLRVGRKEEPQKEGGDIPLPAALTAPGKASEFRVTAGGPVPSSSSNPLRSSTLDRKMSEARYKSRYDRSVSRPNNRDASRYRSREDDYRERFRQLNRDRYDRPDERRDNRYERRDDRYERRDERGRSRFRSSRPSYRSRDSRAEEIEKKDYLMAMEKMKMQGIQLTKNYTMEDSLVDIQYEFERHNLNLESIQKVETSKSYIRILAVVIVVINHFTGRHLKLVGWTEKLSKDLDNPKYFMALEEMCRSMHRRGPPSPWIQLAIMFVSSIFVTHANNQWGLGLGGKPSAGSGNGGGSSGGGGGGGLGGLLGSLGGINLGSVLGTVGSMFGVGGGGAGPRPVPVVPHGPQGTTNPAVNPPASSSNSSTASTGGRTRKPLVRP